MQGIEVPNWKGLKIVITGGLGFIGSTLAARLVELGSKVTLIDSLVPEYGGNLFNINEIREKVNINISDVRDPHSMRHLVQGQDFLFNLAGQTSHADSMLDPYTDLEINCRSQLSILETCRRYNPSIRVVFASTRQIYGRPERLPVNEQHPLRPVDVNGINKLAGECYHILYHNVYGIKACCLRLTNTYGPRMRIKDARQTFVGIWVRSLLEGKPFQVWGGGQLRDFTYVDDVVDAFLLAASSEKAEGKVFNVGGFPPVTLSEAAEQIVRANAGGEYVVVEFPPERKVIDIGDYYSDDKLLRSTLDWSPEVPFEEGIKRTLDYFRVHLKQYV